MFVIYKNLKLDVMDKKPAPIILSDIRIIEGGPLYAFDEQCDYEKIFEQFKR